MQERAPALVFGIRGRHFGLLQEGGATLLPWLQRYAAPGPVHGVPPWVLGLLSVEGAIQTIVDLGAFMGFGASVPGPDSRLIFLACDEIYVGLLVDHAAGIRFLDALTFVDYSETEPLVAGTARMQGQSLQVLDGVALIDALARALDTPHVRRA